LFDRTSAGCGSAPRNCGRPNNETKGSAVTAIAEASPASPPVETPYSDWVLAAGILGRAWLWFLAACVAITIIPVIFGWRPYVIQSGSMQPRIKVGDVVLASPNHNPQQLLGHVTVFSDPAFPGRVKTHRVITIRHDGTLVTKGDANPTADTAPVDLHEVRGLGRLLIRFIGLPLVWAKQGEWLKLIFLGVSIWLAAAAARRDRDPGEGSGPGSDDVSVSEADVPAVASSELEAAGGPLMAEATMSAGADDAKQQTASERRTAERLRRAVNRGAARMALVAVFAVPLMLPTAYSAFAATTANTGDNWAVPNWRYTADGILPLSPYLYYKLDDTGTGNNVNADDASTNGFDGTYTGAAGNYTFGTGGAFTTDTPDAGVTLRNASSCIYTPNGAKEAANGPMTYSLVAWFLAPSTFTAGGKLVGFESTRNAVSDSNNSGQYDRHLYMDSNGRIWFGVWTGVSTAISSGAGLNNGAWHMAVATMATSGTYSGMRLYIDGQLVASSTNTVSQSYTNGGWWRVGCGNLSGWGNTTGANISWSGTTVPSAQANYTFLGSLDEVSVHHGVLTPSEVAFLYWIR
jgi:signal peptidase I